MWSSLSPLVLRSGDVHLIRALALEPEVNLSFLHLVYLEGTVVCASRHHSDSIRHYYLEYLRIITSLCFVLC